MLSSRMEVVIHNVLESNGIPFEEEYTFPDLLTGRGKPLRFDFAVLDDFGEVDFLIEANGEQHYKPVAKFGGKDALRRQRFNDARKRRYCLRNGIKLVVVPYTDAGKISYDYLMKAAGY